MKTITRLTSVILTIILITSFFMFPACQEKKNTVKVMIEQDAHFQVIGENIKETEIGTDVYFDIKIDEGYYYVSNNSGAEFTDNKIIVRDVKTPKTIKLVLQAYSYIVKLHEVDGLKVREGEEYAQKSISVEVNHGESAIFDVQVDEGYEYYQSLVNGTDTVAQTVVYEDGKICLPNVTCDQEIFVQLRKTSSSMQENVTVTLEENEAFTILGESSKVVKNGEDVEFEIAIQEGYYYITNNCGAEYNPETSKLLFKNACTDQVIRLTFGKHNTETSYYTNGVVERTVEGESVVLLAKPNTYYIFNGWYDTSSGKEEVYSYANNLKVQGEMLQYKTLIPRFVFASTSQVITYHANGGKVYGSEDEKVIYAFKHDVYLYPAAFGEWCFKTFYREGYAPIEYNTKADGSGESFSLGSRIFLDEKDVHLYIIWVEENKAKDFNYTYVDENDKELCIKLLKYIGTDLDVVIPQYIDNLPVREIEVNCFKDKNIQSVVLTKNLKKVHNSAFSNCKFLETVYMCDNLEKVSDASFAQCSALKNLRMIAVLPPVYSDHLIGATVRRFELLFNTRNDSLTNIMFYAGSSTFHGLDGRILTEYFGEQKYRIINCAQNAYVSGPLMLELYSYFMKPNDIMTFMPEYSPQLYTSRLELPSWIALEAFYDAFRYMDLRTYTGVFDAFYDLQHGSKSYVYVGKLQQVTERKNLSYEAYNHSFDQYFTRSEDYEIEKATLVAQSEQTDFIDLMRSVVEEINPLYERLYKGKLTMYFAYHAFWEEVYRDTNHGEYEQFLKENLSFDYISNYKNHMYALEYMSDSYSHLTREGAILHSRVIGEELTVQMRADGYPLS